MVSIRLDVSNGNFAQIRSKMPQSLKKCFCGAPQYRLNKVRQLAAKPQIRGAASSMLLPAGSRT